LSVPATTPCSTDDDLVKPIHPSTSNGAECLAWRKQEFNAAEVTPHSYDLAKRAPVSSCRETCDIPTQVGTAIITPGCTDLDDGSGFCPFYTRHFDACGEYDEDESLCCACGGGKTTTTTTTTPDGLESEFSTCTDPVVPPTGYTLCARFGKAKGSSVAVGGPDGNTYLSEAWGHPTDTTMGNNCMNYADDAIMAFRIRTVDGNCDIVVDTGDVAASSNIFKHTLPTGDVKQEQVKLPSGALTEGAGVISLNFANGKQGAWWVGKTCSTAHDNGGGQRSSICISDGTNFHGMMGGINDDGYGFGNGLWICQKDGACGDKEKTVFEVFVKTK